MLPTTVAITPAGFSQTRQIKNRVRFELEHNQELEISHLNDIPRTEINDTWYQKEEYKSFKQDCCHAWHVIQHRRLHPGRPTSLVEDQDYCTRGLELLIDAARQDTRNRHRQVSMQVVMECQRQQQHESGSHQTTITAEYMAEMYHHTTSLSQLEAHSRGLQDELELVRISLSEASTTTTRNAPRSAGGDVPNSNTNTLQQSTRTAKKKRHSTNQHDHSTLASPLTPTRYRLPKRMVIGQPYQRS